MNVGTKEIIRKSPISRVGNLNADVAMVGAHKDVEVSFPSRRREERVNEQKVCAYSLCESLDGQRVTIQQGEVYCINRSEHGILVLMGGRPRKQQLLELHVAETRWEYSLSLYEVQWMKPVLVESHGELFLVGCRLVFGASRYWAF
ncbi:MAG: hypothetical protein E8D52_10270 [Nitrospira sp.]|nr:MAG: hypothetical protein E8D52_10270 [Nitrospira sp.]